MEGVDEKTASEAMRLAGPETADQDEVRHPQGSGRRRACMKAEELRDLSDDDLRARVNELKESLFRMRFKLSLGNTDVVKQLRESRKDLARVKTLLRERVSESAQK
jgi:large subunit ribosomal protein L29